MLSFRYNMTVKVNAAKSTTMNTPGNSYSSTKTFSSTCPSAGSFELTPRGGHSTSGNTIDVEISSILDSAKTNALFMVHNQGIDPSLAVVTGELVGASYRLGPLMPYLEHLPAEISDLLREQIKLTPSVTLKI